MTGAYIKVEDSAVLAALKKLIDITGNPQPALKNVGEYEQKAIKDRIDQGVTPDGKPFQPLNELYKTKKKGPGILRGDSGTLSDIIYQLGDSDVLVGSDAPYSAIQHFGGTIKPKSAAALVFSMGGQTFKVKSVTIPARPYIGVSDADKSAIIEIFKDYLIESSGGAIGR